MKILLSILLLTLYATTFSQTSGTIRTGASGTDTNFVRNVYERNDSLFKELNGSEVFVGMLGSASGVVYDTTDFRIVSGGGYDTVKLKNEPPKEYIAILTQTGTSAPTATILKDDFGDISFSYIADGQYTATSAGAKFTVGKTETWVTNNYMGLGGFYVNTTPIDASTVEIESGKYGGALENIISNVPTDNSNLIINVFHITVYP